MTTNRPFIRNVELLVGPLTDYQGGGPIDQALRIFSDGSRNSLRVQFNIQKTLLSAPNTSVIKIYNLSRGNRERIRQTLSRVRLSVGYQNTDLNLLAQGGILSAITNKTGTDYDITLQVMDGYGGQVRGVTNQTFGSRLPVTDVIRQIAGNMPGVTVGGIDVTGTLGRGGLTVSDRSTEALDRLADQYGFSWSIQDGVFQAIDDRRSFSRSVLVSYRNNNLISATPILNGPLQQTTGVEVKLILDSRLRPGDRIQLESDVNPQLNGSYKVHEIGFSGDTHDNTFETTVKSFKTL